MRRGESVNGLVFLFDATRSGKSLAIPTRLASLCTPREPTLCNINVALAMLLQAKLLSCHLARLDYYVLR